MWIWEASNGNWIVAESAVVDSSPLIFLKAGLLDFLRLAASEILVPESVAEEIRRRGPDDVTARALVETTWLHVTPDPSIPSVIEQWDSGPGESAVLAHVRERPGTIAIIDDGSGRHCAEVLGIPLNGTLGLVMTAKLRGLIPAVRPVVAVLKSRGMFLSDRTIDRAPALIGE